METARRKDQLPGGEERVRVKTLAHKTDRKLATAENPSLEFIKIIVNALARLIHARASHQISFSSITCEIFSWSSFTCESKSVCNNEMD